MFVVILINVCFYCKVEERLVSVDELLDADEVFCTGTAVVVSPVGSITYQGKRLNIIFA
jgi:branched-subunit amino acid aminotransferase/4-amino-4-deoxychorismate lyase